MSNNTRDFHIGDIITITSGILVSLDHVGGIYNILGWMTGEDLMTHQLTRASRECEDNLRAQHPDLAAVVVPKITCEAEAITFLASLYPEFGETRPVSPLPTGDHTIIDPVAEIKMMRPDAQIITLR